MPPLPGFSDNEFISRDDVLRAATSLLGSLTPYKSPCGARIKLSTATGTGFDEISAQLEGFARPLWVVADLLALQRNIGSSDDQNLASLDLESWVRGLEAGVDPESASFWGYLGDCDQRMVEMEPIAYALLSAPAVFYPAEIEKQQKLSTWLRSINDREVPPSNWRWFRVLVNLALVKICGVAYHEVKHIMDADLALLDSFYLGQGWSSDGLWSEDKRQVDYYSGSFAIQYAQLAYVRFARDLDPERVDRYSREADQFSQTFWRYFDVDGVAIPFGRSLTYRFACGAFWSAASRTNITLSSPLKGLGVVKGMVLRHLRWWANQINIFNTDGTFNIGYTYPNMYMSEDYNSPQSLYWSLKTFSILGLPKDHTFWTCEELPHPLATPQQMRPNGPQGENCVVEVTKNQKKLERISVVPPALQMVCSSKEHHFLLSSGQFTRKTHKAREAKYSKFAYSSAFAFSVPTGPLLPELAPDSTLCVSNDDGETWKMRWEPIDARVQTITLSFRTKSQSMASTALISGWRPWRKSILQIETTLIPPLETWPGWHVRIHRLTGKTQEAMQCIDAGFAISSQTVKGGNLPRLGPDLPDELAKEGVWEGNSACLILSDAGASGICDLTYKFKDSLPAFRLTGKHAYRGSILKPDANTNLIAQRTLIPTIHHDFDFDQSHGMVDGQNSGESEMLWFVTGVFAIASSAGLTVSEIRAMWQNKPRFNIQW